MNKILDDGNPEWNPAFTFAEVKGEMRPGDTIPTIDDLALVLNFFRCAPIFGHGGWPNIIRTTEFVVK
jgi:hypothetical protein